MKMTNQNSRLVFSTDPALNRKCAKCSEVLSECICISEVDPKAQKFIAILRVEKQGRSGKTVTVIDRLPANELFLKELTATLKRKCGSGGTHIIANNHGVVEIQGDKRVIIREYFEKERIKFKG